jgi:hypothetical protein
MVEFWLAVIRRAFWTSIGAIGQSEGTLVFAILILLIGAFWVLRKEGWRAMTQHLVSTTAKIVSVPILAWLPFFIFHLLSTPYLRLTEEQERADKAIKADEEKDETISVQKKTIGELEARLKEQPKVVYSDSKSSPQASKPTPTKISNLLVELRAVCTLRDPLKLPNSIGGAFFEKMTSFLEGPTRKVYLRPVTDVRFQRMEQESKASTVLRYDLPSNSDLIGEPVSSLSGYKRMVITLWAIDYNAFTECTFLETTLRVNGIDVLREPATIRLVLVPDKNKWVGIPLNAMKLPQ